MAASQKLQTVNQLNSVQVSGRPELRTREDSGKEMRRTGGGGSSEGWRKEAGDDYDVKEKQVSPKFTQKKTVFSCTQVNQSPFL